MKLATQLAQIGSRSCQETGAVNPPIYLSTAYGREGLGLSSGYDYTRTKNPTRTVLEETIAHLEGGDRGFACSSGMAAINIVLSLFQSQDEIIFSSDLYGGTYRLLEEVFSRWGLVARYVDTADAAAITPLINEKTKAIFVETPTNPMMIESDIEAISEIANAHELLLIVDNTFYTPILQRPICAGAHIVIHSATKYLGGHNDVLAGLIVVKGEDLAQQVEKIHNGAGAVLSPFDSWLLMRGMKTLKLRLTAQQHNTKELSEFLSSHSLITDVYYPGKGGMLSFKLKDEAMIDTFLKALNVVIFAESLGGTESFITYPATQTHADIPKEVREAVGVCDRLLRFSVGIEDIEDLIADLYRALAIAGGVRHVDANQNEAAS